MGEDTWPHRGMRYQGISSLAHILKENKPFWYFPIFEPLALSVMIWFCLLVYHEYRHVGLDILNCLLNDVHFFCGTKLLNAETFFFLSFRFEVVYGIRLKKVTSLGCIFSFISILNFLLNFWLSRIWYWFVDEELAHQLAFILVIHSSRGTLFR